MEILSQISLVHTAAFVLGLVAVFAALISRVRFGSNKQVLGTSQKTAFVTGIGLIIVSVAFSIDDLVNAVVENILLVVGFGVLGWGAHLNLRFRKDNAD